MNKLLYSYIFLKGKWLDCWTTGCQPNDWAVVGCEQYKKIERQKFPCTGGYKYDCCTKNANFTETTTPATSGITKGKI